jgi:hypothetical protein
MNLKTLAQDGYNFERLMQEMKEMQERLDKMILVLYPERKEQERA